jgi:plasmid stabilization system protein ParE
VKQYHVTFSKLARRQLDHLYDDIADLSHPDIALGYVERIEAFCHRLGSE